MTEYNSAVKGSILNEIRTNKNWKYVNNTIFGTKQLEEIHSISKLNGCSKKQMLYRVNSGNKYVVKFFELSGDAEYTAVANQIKIGTVQGIEDIGVRVHAVLPRHKDVIVIMDHSLLGNNTLRSESLFTYITRHREHVKTKIITKMISDALVIFYKITGGFHGDLHLGNIVALFDNDNVIHHVKIIDYSSFVPFSNPKDAKLLSLDEYMNMVKNTFNMLPIHGGNKYAKQTFFPDRIPVKHDKTGMFFRSNANMMNEYKDFVKNISIQNTV